MTSAASALHTLRRALVPSCSRTHMFRWPADVPPPSLPRDPAYSWLFPCPPERLLALDLAAVGLLPATVCELERQGDLFGVVVRDGRLVHRSFVQTRGHIRLAADPRAILLAPGQRHIHYCETAPDERGRGLYPAMIQLIAADLLASRGATEVLIFAEQGNPGSVRGILKAGFRYACSWLSASLAFGRLRRSLRYRDPAFA